MAKNVTRKNYDLIFKLAAGVFKGRILDFLGIDCVEIERTFATELPGIEASSRETDFIFKLKDGSLLHFEFQTGFSAERLFEIFMYDARLVKKYKKAVKTVIVYSGDSNTLQDGFNLGSVNYKTQIIYIRSKYDWEKVYGEEAEKIEAGRQPDWIKLIFLPLAFGKSKKNC